MNFITVTIRVPEQPYLDWTDVIALTKLSETTIRRMIKDGQFPEPVGGLWSNMQIGAWMLWRDHGPRPRPRGAEAAREGEAGEEGEGEAPLAARRPRPRAAE